MNKLHHLWTVEAVEKPFTTECYHYSFGDVFLGAVWQPDDVKFWSAHCNTPGKYGHLGDFHNRAAAEQALASKLLEDPPCPIPLMPSVSPKES